MTDSKRSKSRILAADRSQQAHKLFEAAMDLDPAEATRFLHDSCGDDQELREEVESLLKHHRLAGESFMRFPSAPIRDPQTCEGPDPRIGTTVGNYKITSVIAMGGMGTVYEAAQRDPRRTVALKIMKGGIASRSAIRRFEFEAQTLAQLHHPGIAQIYEAGMHTDPGSGPVPFFAMEYIPGARPITGYTDEKRMALDDRLRLFAAACDAIQHGHQMGVIHRDLKPSNILVDVDGQVKIIDFGVARSTDSDLALTTTLTDSGQLIGTMQYMSPEQFQSDPQAVDVRSDVYSLGVVLFELLTGQLPYDVTGTALHAAPRIICEQPPVRPSSLDRRLKGDLEVIILTALEKDRQRRYQSAGDLAKDIRRHLAREPIQAKPPTRWYLLKTLVQRHKLPTGLIALTFVLVVAFAVTMSVQLRRTRAARKAERWKTYTTCIQAASAALADNDSRIVRESLSDAPQELRDWEWYYLNAACDDSIERIPLRGAEDRAVHTALLTADGTRAFVVFRDGVAGLWDVLTGDPVGREVVIRRTSAGSWRPCSYRALSNDDSLVAVECDDGTLQVSDIRTRKRMHLFECSYRAAISFSPVGSILATSGNDGMVSVFNMGPDDPIDDFLANVGGVSDLLFSPDGQSLVTGGADGTVKLWDVATWQFIRELRRGGDPVSLLTFSRDGSQLAWRDFAGDIVVWNARTDNTLSWNVQSYDTVGWAMAFSPDGSRLVSTHGHLLRVWDASTGEQVAVLRRPTYVGPVAFVENGKRIASASLTPEGILEFAIFGMFQPAKLAELHGHMKRLRSAVFDPEGRLLASASADGTVRLWDPALGEELVTLQGHTDEVITVTFSSDGLRLASSSKDGTVRIWNALTGISIRRLSEPDERSVPALAFSPDGKWLATGNDSGTVRLWNVDTGRLERVIGYQGDIIKSLVFDPNGGFVASGSLDGKVNLWDLRTGADGDLTCEGQRGLQQIAISLDGRSLASGGSTGWEVCLHDLTELAKNPLRLTQQSTCSLAFHPWKTRLATGANDGSVRIWTTTGETVLVRKLSADVGTVAFSADGTRLAAGTDEGVIHILDSVPFGIRYQERKKILAANDEAKEKVEELYKRLNDWSSVAEEVRKDSSLSQPLRHAALNEILRRASSE